MHTTVIIPETEIETLGRVDRLIDMARQQTIDLYHEDWGRILRLGRSRGSHIHRAEQWISRDQAVLVRRPDERWDVAHVPGAGNPTRLNGVRVPDAPGFITLEVGSILRIGWTVFLATNADHEDAARWVLTARHEREFYCCALLVYGSFLAAAAAIGVPETTFRDRIKRWAAQGDRMAQDALHLAELQRRSKGKRRRTHPLPIATMAIRMEILRFADEGDDQELADAARFGDHDEKGEP